MRITAWLGTLFVALVCLGDTQADDARAIEDILTRLENRSASLKDIRCRVVFTEEDRVNLTKRRKIGRILFRMDDPNPQFLIHFEKTELDAGVLGRQEWYRFDGEWLQEGVERLRQVTRRKLADPGEKLDFFSLERAPFPMPFGHKKKEILDNFDVKRLAGPSDRTVTIDHLVCTPKPGSPFADRYVRIEFFVDRNLHLPRRIVAKKTEWETIDVEFPDLSTQSLNSGLTARDLAEPDEWKNYRIVVEGGTPVVRNPR